MSVDGGLTWENFSNAPSHVLYSSGGNVGYASNQCIMVFVENGALEARACKNGTSYTFGDVSLKVYVSSANASCYYEITNNGNKPITAYNTYDGYTPPNHTINPGETNKISGMNSASSCAFMW